MSPIDQKRRALQCRIYPLSSLSPYLFVVICSRYHGRWLFSKHRHRDTWETQGGHIEKGESTLRAAERELYEESGVRDADLYPVCDYLGYDKEGSAAGVVFLADIHALGNLPQSEMCEVALFDTLPTDLTYPSVTPRLLAQAARKAEELGIP